MANEISYADPLGATGLNLYVRIRTPVNAFWNGSAFESYDPAHWATYAVPLTEAGGGLYLADMPTVPAGAYYLDAYKRAGGGPAATDQLLGATPYPMQWDGTAEVTLNAVGSADLGGIAASLAASKELTPAAIVADSAPTRGGFTIAMADSSDVPNTFIWRNSEAWFDGTRDTANGRFLLSGGKYLIATYTKLTATTARLTFSPLLPVAPANGDTLLLA